MDKDHLNFITAVKERFKGAKLVSYEPSMNQEEWLHKIEQLVRAFASARAERVYLEHFRKSKKSLLMSKAFEVDSVKYKSSAAQEVFAYQHPEYLELLEGLKAAVEKEELCRWNLKQREMKFEAWRSENANRRMEHSRYGN